jgi:hypothetical protein
MSVNHAKEVAMCIVEYYAKGCGGILDRRNDPTINEGNGLP